MASLRTFPSAFFVVALTAVITACPPPVTRPDADAGAPCTGTMCDAQADSSSDAVTDTATLGELGAPCTTNDQCTTGICLMIGRCSRTCSMRTDCPTSANWLCANLPGRGTICACTMETGRQEIACNGVDDNCDSVIDENSRMCGAACADIANDPMNCGSCGIVCGGGQVCSAGMCMCPPERSSVCGGQCTDTQTNVMNCGMCGNVCPAGTTGAAACTAGRCSLICPAGSGDCDADPANGCETNTSSSLTHCGMCGRACAFTNATGTCSTGSCVIGACSTGFGNCDGDGSNGCETDTRTTLAHCGGCGLACVPPNGVGACAAGACSLAACNVGFANCDVSSLNGCEVNTQTSPANCGSCGRVCPGAGAPNTVAGCAAGMCTIACVTGFGDCDASTTNGCEVDLSNADTNCGACGRACPAGEACVAAACVPARGATQLSCGGGHTCARMADGTARCWGLNDQGQLGDGTMANHGALPVTGLSGVVQVAAGAAHTCARLLDGTARCWGSNGYGEGGTGIPGNMPTPTPVVGLTGIAQLAVGGTHTCARLTDGTARCWGANDRGELGDGTMTNRTMPVVVGGLTGVTDIALGFTHACAVVADRTVRCWGLNSSGQLGDGTMIDRALPVAVTGLTNVSEVAVGLNTTCARLLDGSARCWGEGLQGGLGDGTTIDRSSPAPVMGLTGVAQIGAGARYGCARMADRTERCWGANGNGMVGDGTGMFRTTPVPVTGLASIASIAVGVGHNCSVLTDGTARCWGANQYGQIGNSMTMTVQLTPTMVHGL